MEHQVAVQISRLFKTQFAAYFNAAASDRCNWVLDALCVALEPEVAMASRRYAGWHLHLIWLDGALCVADFKLAVGGSDYGNWTAQAVPDSCRQEVRRHAARILAELRRMLRKQGMTVAHWPALPLAA